ncbi:MAG: ChbG/HpnK family deacetylase [Minisyncoccia bacterium]
MNSHARNLLVAVPDLLERRVLDVGCGRGGFLADFPSGVGIEINPEKVQMAKDSGCAAEIIVGDAEALPFENDSFGFVNLGEVIEHVKHPEQVLKEIHRVLAVGGAAYISVPNRFGWFDPHFRIPFVNWLPRWMSDWYISLWNIRKDYSAHAVDLQRLSDMHYFTPGAFRQFARRAGFTITDLRALKVKRRFGILSLAAYYPLRPWYFSTSHFLLQKSLRHPARQVTVTADDFGLSRGITESIACLFSVTPLSKVSVVANGSYFTQAVELLEKNPTIAIAVHLNLTEGKPVSSQENVASLVDAHGDFRHSSTSFFLKSLFYWGPMRKKLARQIRTEIEAQVTRVESIFPSRSLSINGHEHIHLAPLIRDEIIAVCAGRVAEFRLIQEPFPQPLGAIRNRHLWGPNLIKHMLLNAVSRRAQSLVKRAGFSAPDAFVGVFQTGAVTFSGLTALMRGLPDTAESIEVLFHPGHALPGDVPELRPRTLSWHYARTRIQEADLLKSAAFRTFIDTVRS